IQVSGPGERQHAPAVSDRHLRDQMRCGSETVDTERCYVPGMTVGAIADQACAQQRGRFDVRVPGRQLEAVGGVCDGVFRITAVMLISGEARINAKVFATLHAPFAVTTARGQPRHAYPLTESGADNSGAVPYDLGDDLVAGNHRQLGLGELAV